MNMQRNPGESFKAYRERQKAAGTALKQRLGGRLLWCAVRIFQEKEHGPWLRQLVNGTYVRKVHGPLGDQRRDLARRGREIARPQPVRMAA